MRTNEALQQSLRNLESAFTAFFRKNAKYPKYKSKKHSKQSIKFINCVHFNFDEWFVKLPKIGRVNLCKNKVFDSDNCKQGTCTVTVDSCGTYWCMIVIDDLKDKPTKVKLDKNTAVGIDLGIKDYAILSDGTKISNPKYLEAKLKKLAHLQKVFARTVKGSKNHEKMRVKIVKCHRKIFNRRSDFLHKLTAYLVKNYDTICLETLNIDGLLKNRNLSLSIQSVSWHEFIRQIKYKSEWYGKNLIFIGRFEPSSKLCHKCGYINKELKLSDREWTCPVCGELHDRDINAAINIKEIAFDRQNLIGLK